MQMNKAQDANYKLHRLKRWLRWITHPVALFILAGTALSLSFSRHEASQQQLELESSFKTTAQQTGLILQEKIDRFTLLLKAGRGLALNYSDLPDTELNRHWHQMFNSYDMRYSDLGIVGLSYTRYLAPEERTAFVDRFNRHSDRQLTIFPPPTMDAPSFVVMHLTPAQIEKRMLGYDLYSGELRRQAAMRAMTSGKISVTLPLTLLPSDINSLDYLLLLPVQNNAAFLGWVTLGFSMSYLIEECLSNMPSPLRIQLVDPRLDSEMVTYDSHPDLEVSKSLLSYTTDLNLAGEKIRLQITPLPSSLHTGGAGYYHGNTLISGISLTLLVASLLLFFIQITRNPNNPGSSLPGRSAEELYRRYRILFTHSPEAIVVHIDGIVELANDHAASLFGCSSPDQLLQRNINTLVHPDSLDFALERREAMTRGETLEPAEMKLMRLNGSIFEAEVTSSLIQYRSKQAVQVVFRDITAAKQQRHISSIAQAAFQYSHDAIMVTDSHGRIELVNKAFHKLTGYSPQAIKGRCVSILNSGQHDNTFFFRMWKALNDSGEWSGDIVNRKRQGELYIQETFVTAIKDREQHTRHYVCLMRDVTDKRNGFDYSQLSSIKNQLEKMYSDPCTGSGRV